MLCILFCKVVEFQCIFVLIKSFSFFIFLTIGIMVLTWRCCWGVGVKYVPLQLFLKFYPPPMAIVWRYLHCSPLILKVSLSLFPGAEALLPPAGSHLGVCRSSSCTGQRCPRRESLLPRLGTGAEKHGPPFRRGGRSCEEDTEVFIL